MVFIQPIIPVNNPIQFTLTFVDVNGVEYDPDSGIVFNVTDPNGNMTTYTYPTTVTKSAVGIYYVVVTLNVAGDWVVNGQGVLSDGTPVTSQDIVQRVQASSTSTTVAP